MRINRAQLKGIIKECLLEIFTDGLGDSLVESASKHRSISNASSIPRSVPRPRVNAKKLVEQVSTKNSVLDGLLMETASTTLQSMLQNDPSVYGDAAQQQVGPSDRTGGLSPEQLFGEDVSSSWLAVLDQLEK